MKGDPIKWTDEMDALLREFIANGVNGSKALIEFTARFHVPVNRNMLSGRRRRLGISKSKGPREKRSTQPEQTKPPYVEEDVCLEKITEEAPLVPEEEEAATKKKLFDLVLSDCRWPIGDPRSADFHFCGKLREANSSYCSDHFIMSRQKLQRRVGQ